MLWTRFGQQIDYATPYFVGLMVMTDTKRPARPLSPHLHIYRWSWTMAMSVAHRLTGLTLYCGTLLIAAWLVAAAAGPEEFETAQAIALSLPGRTVLFAYTFVLFHHMAGGVRHMIWDTGRGHDPHARRALAKYSLAFSASVTVLVWVVASLGV